MDIQPSDLRKYRFFSTLSDKALEILCGKLEIVRFQRGDTVIEAGAPGDAFYFVKDGRLEVSGKTPDGQKAALSVIGSGHGFGEMALLSCSSRSCSVAAASPATLYRLAKTDFDDIVLHESAFKDMLLKKVENYEHYNRIKMLQPFALLEPDRMYALLARMAEEVFQPGQDIIRQGEKGDFYYIVQSGKVAVLKRKKGSDEEQQVALLSDGEGFGEEALIRDDPRNATCRAIEETTVLALDKTDFARILKDSFLEYIYSEDIDLDTYMDKYIIIDARIPPEHEEEHIHGSVNIPLEQLRHKYAELDHSKEYITYCTNDSRGMVAAFLLKNHGFRARCLRGGVSGWLGEVVTGSSGIHMPMQ